MLLPYVSGMMGRPRKTGIDPLILKKHKWNKIDQFILAHGAPGQHREYQNYRAGNISFEALSEATQGLLGRAMTDAQDEISGIIKQARDTSSARHYYQAHRDMILAKLWLKRHQDATNEEVMARLLNKKAETQKKYIKTSRGKEAKKRANANYNQTEKGKKARRDASKRYRDKIDMARMVARQEA